MLQIIGWMGCVYLFVKGIEFMASRNYRNNEGGIGGAAIVGPIICWLSAFAFALILNVQAGTASSFTP
jgi:hypothetical protein